jgi:hypothetical protein
MFHSVYKILFREFLGRKSRMSLTAQSLSLALYCSICCGFLLSTKPIGVEKRFYFRQYAKHFLSGFRGETP